MRRNERAERFERIYRAHAEAILAYARRRAPADAAEEVVAETFLVCWRRLSDVPENALPWLYAVARKTLANQRRARRRPQGASPIFGTAGGVDPVVERDPALRAALARLREADRELLALVAWEGLSLADVAATLGCSPATCRVRLHRAKRRLACLLAEGESDEHRAAAMRGAHSKGAAP